jgi:hypothetical protein
MTAKPMQPCKTCGAPARTVRRRQGGGNLASYCSKECLSTAGVARTKGWRKTPAGAYASQRHNALQRGIEWLFELDSWIAWWGDDFYKRGNKVGQLMMCRYGDVGPYSPTNCCKGTAKDNAQHKSIRYHSSKLVNVAGPGSLFVVGLLGFGL